MKGEREKEKEESERGEKRKKGEEGGGREAIEGARVFERKRHAIIRMHSTTTRLCLNGS